MKALAFNRESPAASHAIQLFVLLVFVAMTSACGRAGASAARGARKGVARSMARVWERDAARDARLVAKPLASERTVFRYTTPTQAARDARDGVSAGLHMTSRGGPGRPLSGTAARERFGLAGVPTVRETIRLPKGQSVKIGKAIGGKPGVGELTPSTRVPAASIKRAVRTPPE